MAAFWLLASAGGSAQQDREYQIKAAFLYQFASYVEWPADAFDSPASPLYFGVVGAAEMRNNLSALAQEHTVNGRPIRLLEPDLASSDVPLHILFIGKEVPASELPGTWVPDNFPTLVVTEADIAQPPFGMINFQLVDNRVRFDVALANAEAAGLRLSSRLLQVARQVVRQP